ncbi:MAG: FKBP-type peptidyl-prolyl cis-trans isomerase [Crocinitomicaceae bacterium]|jgi:FKBP-type peptidyl-prolyl cis-trans isomerase|nr:FKBP-type peptidyl-prolyl cis-trans isomerase [Crocinitomicaceae bacterium]
MKNTIFVLLGLILISCSGDNEPITLTDTKPKIEFKDFTEKISYCIGLDHAFAAYTIYASQENKLKFDMMQIESGMVDYLSGNELRIPFDSRDSIFDLYLLDDGSVNEQAVSKIDASYAIGMEEAFVLVSSLVGRGIDQAMDVPMLVTGVRDGIQNSNPALSVMEARTEVAKYYSELNKENGILFLQENANRDSVVVTESGLQYVVFREGKGIRPNLTDTCIVHYTGRFIDGREFESTIPSQRPIEFTPLGLIPGWQEGLLLMNEGARYRLFMPQELAYGEKGSGPIEPFCALVFDVELIKVKRFK